MAESKGKREIRSIEIEPAKNGGHTVRHHYKASANYSRTQGMGMEHHAPEEFVFGAGEGAKLAAHLGKHLALKNSPDSKAAYSGPEGEED